MDDECTDVDIKKLVLENIFISLEELRDVCEIAYDQQEIIYVSNKLIPGLQRPIDNCLIEARQHIQDMKNEINTLWDEIQLLQQTLSGNLSEVAICESLTLKEKKMMLIEILEPLRKQKDEHLSILKQLRDEEHVILENLGRENIYLLESDIPTSEELNNLKSYIENLNKEMVIQKGEIEQLKNEIIKLVNELGIESEFDSSIKAWSNDLTDKSLEKLREIYNVLIMKKEQHVIIKDKLMNKLSNLWNRINMDINEREEFLVTHQDYKECSIKAFENEIERCEELKKLHLTEYIQGLRVELEDLWSICKIGEEEKIKNGTFSSDLYNEQIVDEYEEMIEYYRNFYATNKKLFDLLEERFKLYDQYMHLENAANNPNRLFQNRGGKLLQEEKTRKKILSSLPKFDKEIQNLVRDYEAFHQRQFLYFGRPLKEVLEETSVSKKKILNKENAQLVSSSGVKVMKPFPKKSAGTPQMSNRLNLRNAETVVKSAPPGRVIRKNMFSGEQNY